MTATLSSTGTATAVGDVRIRRSTTLPQYPYALELGEPGEVTYLLTAQAFEGLYADATAELMAAEGEAREAEREPIPAEPYSPLVDRLTTEWLHDVAEGRQP